MSRFTLKKMMEGEYDVVDPLDMSVKGHVSKQSNAWQLRDFRDGSMATVPTRKQALEAFCE